MILYLVLVILSGVGYYVLLSKYTSLWNAWTSGSSAATKVFSISIVVPFRNEAEHLPNLILCLKSIHTLGHSVEVIFINDHSTDSSVSIVQACELPFDKVILELAEGQTGKKNALRLAWAGSSSDIILQTDADCSFKPDWLTQMVHPFTNDKTELVSGPVSFTKADTFWEKIVALDFAALIAIGAAHIQWGVPMICNGANLAYQRKLTFNADLTDYKASGDDIFLLQSAFASSEEGIFFNKNPSAMVSTPGPYSFSEFWHQRLRWASKNSDYDLKKNTYILTLVWFLNVLIVCSFLSWSATGFTAGLFLVFLKVLAEAKFYGAFVSFFGFGRWFKTICLGQPFHILYMAIVPPLSQFIKYKWKERKLS